MVRKCRGLKKIMNKLILRFFNKNKRSQYIDIRLRFKGDKTYGYLINGTKKKKQEIIIPNIETFLIKFHLSKEEKIGRSFSNYYTMKILNLYFHYYQLPLAILIIYQYFFQKMKILFNH